MTDPTTPYVPTDLDRQRFRKLVRLTLAAFLACIIVGAVGGYLVWNDVAGKSVPRIAVLMPTVAAVIVFMTPLFFLRRRWFPDKELLLTLAGAKKD